MLVINIDGYFAFGCLAIFERVVATCYRGRTTTLILNNSNNVTMLINIYLFTSL